MNNFSSSSPKLPALLSVLFTVRSDYSAELCIHNDNAALHVTVIHDGFPLCSYEADQSTIIELTVQDHEAIIILVRHESAIVASGIYEVDMRLVETIGEVLLRRMESNIALHQDETTMLNRALEEGIERAMRAAAQEATR